MNPQGDTQGTRTQPVSLLATCRAAASPFPLHAWAATVRRAFCVSPGSITSQVNFHPIILFLPRTTTVGEKSAKICPGGTRRPERGRELRFLTRSPPLLFAHPLTSEVWGLVITQRWRGISRPCRGHRKSRVEVWHRGKGGARGAGQGASLSRATGGQCAFKNAPSSRVPEVEGAGGNHGFSNVVSERQELIRAQRFSLLFSAFWYGEPGLS